MTVGSHSWAAPPSRLPGNVDPTQLSRRWCQPHVSSWDFVVGTEVHEGGDKPQCVHLSHGCIHCYFNEKSYQVQWLLGEDRSLQTHLWAGMQTVVLKPQRASEEAGVCLKMQSPGSRLQGTVIQQVWTGRRVLNFPPVSRRCCRWGLRITLWEALTGRPQGLRNPATSPQCPLGSSQLLPLAPENPTSQ